MIANTGSDPTKIDKNGFRIIPSSVNAWTWQVVESWTSWKLQPASTDSQLNMQIAPVAKKPLLTRNDDPRLGIYSTWGILFEGWEL